MKSQFMPPKIDTRNTPRTKKDLLGAIAIPILLIFYT